VRDDVERVRQLIECLRDQSLSPERFEVIVGGDGTPSKSLRRVETPDDRVRVEPGPRQTSYAARNRAARTARGAVLAFCDSDCLPDRGWLEQGLAALENADVVAGEVVLVPPPRPTVWSLCTMDMYLDQERNVLLSRAVTANLFVRRRLFDELDGFDDSLPSGGDYDFVRRACARGALVLHAPSAVVRHPTIDDWRAFLRKVWRTNRWAAFRSAKARTRTTPRSVLTFVPVLGVVLARRAALRPICTLQRSRLRHGGLEPGLLEDLRALPVLYFLAAYVGGVARVRGWLDGRRTDRSTG
jgi:GT2 family glycosyltransferase